MPTQYLNLDEIASEVPFVLTLKGKRHELKIATVADFCTNMKELEKLSINASATAEVEVTIGIILRSFPTMTRDDLDSLTMVQLQKIVHFARVANGEIAETAAGPEVAAEGNAPAAK